jgi:hypothetical protein
MKKIVLLFVTIALYSCQKLPTAEIKADRQEYNAGETVYLTNLSKDADSYKWIMPDGTKITSKSAEYILPGNLSDTSLKFTLQAISKKGKYVDETGIYVTVKETKGSAVFYTNSYQKIPFYVYIDGEYYGQGDSYYYSTPTCSAIGCVTVTDLSTGVHSVEVSCSGLSKTSTIDIGTGTCTPFLFQ